MLFRSIYACVRTSATDGFTWNALASGTAFTGVTIVACSGTGRYFITGSLITDSSTPSSYTQYISSDYGATIVANNGLGSCAVYACSVSYTGQYMICVAGNTSKPKISSDFGGTWTTVTSLPPSLYYFGCAISRTGNQVYIYSPYNVYTYSSNACTAPLVDRKSTRLNSSHT